MRDSVTSEEQKERREQNERQSDSPSLVMQQALQSLRAEAFASKGQANSAAFENAIKNDPILNKLYPAFPDQIDHESVSGSNTTRNPYVDSRRDCRPAIDINRMPVGDRNFGAPHARVDAPLLAVGDAIAPKNELRIVSVLQAPTESVQSMASRLLMSAGAGYVARQGLFMSGLHRTPVVGPMLCLTLPLTAAGLSSVYLKHDSLNVLENKQSFIEGMLAYGVCFRGFDKAIGDAAGGYAERSVLRADLLTATSSIRRPFARFGR